MARRRVKQRAYSGPNCFNKLPDDIIIDRILPLLGLKQRIRSSVLSRRWRNLWKYTRLEHLHVSGTYLKHLCGYLLRGPHPHFGYYSRQLKTLEFDMTVSDVAASPHFDLELPMLSKLEEVKVKMHSICVMVLLWPCCLLKSAPRLKRFVVEHRRAPIFGYPVGRECKRRLRESNEQTTARIVEATKFKHPCLKVIEFVGVHKVANHKALAFHLVSCAESLEKLVLDTLERPDEFKEYARNFRRRIPSEAQLVLL